MKPAPLLVTLGDAVGIGPEIVLRAFRQGRAADCVVVGEPAVLQRAARLIDPLGVPLAVVDEPGALEQVPPGALPVLRPQGLPAGLAELPWGQVDARCGAAAAACIQAAVALVRAGQAGGIVTAPIHKEALAAAGVSFPGHTEMLQALAADPGGALPPVRMMLANEELRVVLVTIHVSLRRAIELVTREAVLQTLRIVQAAVPAWAGGAPRIAVAGLNPHAGEGGLFGDEEQAIIAPAIAQARAEGIAAAGPFAPDTVFMRARRRAGYAEPFDVVVAMTHDHGLIPVKYLGVEHGVNVTLGLPFVRTSPDHGTAFDIAGRGVADASSLVAAIEAAQGMARGSPAPSPQPSPAQRERG
ncbi:MAG: 4-hydroxythreonine-4-phosphate dehydrogenase PdxA [Rubrivivax sp. SCN 71-131]|jgi:4-hydroxythreonine-4-phosphate dehydrogenase|nr:MAG: 4-hydroxythreonine-4-phosphate dehydrogenase PdxA [Rubrivivax sp. SCN 71-131]